MTTYYKAQDIDGNVWPNWNVEEFTSTARMNLIRTFNRIFADEPHLLYPGCKYKGMPLPDDTPAYLIHNERFALRFSEHTARRCRRCTNEYCQISLAYLEATGFPALTGQGEGRVMHVVHWDLHNESRPAIYRLDVPKKLSLAALDFDDYDKVDQFEDLWDSDNESLGSTVPSRGRAIRSTMYGGSRGWKHTVVPPDRYRRPTLRRLLKEYA